jgi:hypothetical protein
MGGTDVAVQLGIKLNKPVYVFDLDTQKWYTQDLDFLANGYNKNKHDWLYNGWIETDTPKLTKNFAGVGTRDIESYNVKNKETNKWEPRKQYVGKQLEEIAAQAIRDVYKNTFSKIEEPTIKPGAYVKYKNNTYIVTKINDNGTIQLYDPRKEGSDSKISISVKTILSAGNKILPNVAKIVYFDKTGHNYIVTEKGTIISLQTNTRMDWDENNGNRKALLKLAEESDNTTEPTQTDESFDEEGQFVESVPVTFRELDAFSDDAKVRILANFANQHGITEEFAEKSINQRLAEGKKEMVIKELRKCNM